MPVIGSITPNRSRLVGVAGGSGSGKTYFARELQRVLGDSFCEIIYQDNFYIDQSHRFDGDGGSVNFDHPESIDFDLLARCLADLKEGKSTRIPIYEFATHRRLPETLSVSPRPVILVDGILIFHASPVRELFDDLIYFDTPEVLRYQRRLERDVQERGRTPDGVRRQFERQVKPMHDTYVEPSKVHAHRIVNDLAGYADVLAEYVRVLKETTVGPS